MGFGLFLFGRSSWGGDFPQTASVSPDLLSTSDLSPGSAPQSFLFTGYGDGETARLAGEALGGTGTALTAPLRLNGQSYHPEDGPLRLTAGWVAQDPATGCLYFIGLVCLDTAERGLDTLGTVISRGWSPAAPDRWQPGPQAGARLVPLPVTKAEPPGNPFRNSRPSLGAAFAQSDFTPLSQQLCLGSQSLGLIDEPADQPLLAAGTVILTRRGPVPVEQLGLGDLVLTVDHGYRPLRWIGRCQLSAEDLARKPDLRPIRIRQGALGPEQPTQDLLVSPQHRILVRSTVLERLFEVREALVAVRHLLFLAGIDLATELEQIDYYHLMFDSHEVIFSNGAMTETLHSGPEAMAALDPAALAEILLIFPELRSGQPSDMSGRARLFLTGTQGRELARTHRELGGALYA